MTSNPTEALSDLFDAACETLKVQESPEKDATALGIIDRYLAHLEANRQFKMQDYAVDRKFRQDDDFMQKEYEMRREKHDMGSELGTKNGS
tara:strand:- start:398 stop:670 length:273 start_codon:yes stop_codon:yes gene_type:complete